VKALESFKIYYHPHQYSRLFLFAFESLNQAEKLIQKSHSGFVRVNKDEVKYPYITISEANQTEQKKPELFFCRIEK
jgi:hypothetical protein